MQITVLIAAFEALLAAAPGVVGIAEKVYALISALFTAKLITIEQQKAIFDHCNAVQAATEAGEKPPSWEVQPDPLA